MPQKKRKQTGNPKSNKSDVKLYGRALLSLQNVVGILGESGEEIFKENKVTEIAEKGLYSPRLRLGLWDSILDRYGGDGLDIIGRLNADIWESDTGKMQAKYIAKLNSPEGSLPDKFVIHNYRGLNSDVSLHDMAKMHIDTWDVAIKIVTFAPENAYGAQLIKLGPLRYKYKLRMTGIKVRHYNFPLACIHQQLTRWITAEWDFKLKFDEKNSYDDSDYGCLFSIIASIKKGKDLRNPNVLANEIKQDSFEALLKSVLKYSDDQKKELGKEKKRVERLSKQLGKYLPPQIHQSLFSGRYNTEITTRRKKLTIFFSDIANFTSTSEGLQPEDLTKYLNEYFSEMTTIALDCGATIDKYIGDAMMVFFGDPESNGEKKDARGCVEMALKMQDRMVELQDRWANEGFADPFQVRIGINTGYCNVGNFGSDQRLTYTIIGGEVNVAQRLESSADSNGILMSYETYAHAQDMIEVEERKTIKMKGISRDIKVFSVIGRKTISESKEPQIMRKPKKDELSEFEIMKKDVARIDNNLHELNKKIEAVLKKL